MIFVQRIFVFVLLVGGISSCSIKPVTVSNIGEVKVKEYSLKGVTVEVDVTVKNPNWMGFKIYRSDLNVKLNNMDLGKASIMKNVKVKRNAETNTSVTLEADFTKLGPAVLLTAGQVFSRKGAKPSINVSGELKAGNLFVKKRFPINVNQKVSLSK